MPYAPMFTSFPSSVPEPGAGRPAGQPVPGLGGRPYSEERLQGSSRALAREFVQVFQPYLDRVAAPPVVPSIWPARSATIIR